MSIPRENPDMWDQLVVRVWKWCNFRCNFCNVSTNESHVKLRENIDDIVRNFHYKMKYSSFKGKWIEITISWWEPSIYKKEVIFALKYIKGFLDKRGIKHLFSIQTNASSIDVAFAYRLKKLWVQSALVSFHTNDKNIFEQTLWISYDLYFPKIISWIKNLIESWIYVDTNTILSNQNKYNFLDTIDFLLEKFPDIYNYNIGIIQPHWEAEKNILEVAPIYKEVSHKYNQAIDLIESKNKKVTSHFVGLPLCFLDNHNVSLERNSNLEFRKNYNFSEKYLINKINDQNKTQIPKCRECMFNNVCSWLWKNYVWIQDVMPQKYTLDFLWNSKMTKDSFRLISLEENIGNLYNEWMRQVIIRSGSFSKNDTKKIIKKLVQQWFYKISLVIESWFQLPDEWLYIGITNIQMKYWAIPDATLRKLCSFSDDNSPQFSIDIDILVDTKNSFINIKNNYIKYYEYSGKDFEIITNI